MSDAFLYHFVQEHVFYIRTCCYILSLSVVPQMELDMLLCVSRSGQAAFIHVEYRCALGISLEHCLRYKVYLAAVVSDFDLVGLP